MADDLNLDGRDTEDYGADCPLWDECRNTLTSTEDFNVGECTEHGRWRFIAEHNSYEPIDL